MAKITRQSIESRLQNQIRNELAHDGNDAVGLHSDLTHRATGGAQELPADAFDRTLAPLRDLPAGPMTEEALKSLPLSVRFRARNVHALLLDEKSQPASPTARELGTTHSYVAERFQEVVKELKSYVKELRKPIEARPLPDPDDTSLKAKMARLLGSPEAQEKRAAGNKRRAAEAEQAIQDFQAIFSGDFKKLRRRNSRNPMVAEVADLKQLAAALEQFGNKIEASSFSERTTGSIRNDLYAAVGAIMGHASMPAIPADADGAWFARLADDDKRAVWSGVHNRTELHEAPLSCDGQVVAAGMQKLLGEDTFQDLLDNVTRNLQETMDSCDSTGPMNPSEAGGEVLLLDGKQLGYAFWLRVDNGDYSATVHLKTDLEGNIFDSDYSGDHI